MLRYFKQDLCDGGLHNPTGSLPVFHHRPSYAQKAKSKLSAIKNLHDMHVHNSLLNIAIHMPCVNIHSTGCYQLEMVFVCACLPLIAMGNTLYGSDCI